MDILTKVKNAIGITSDSQDETIKVYIDNIKAYMVSAGVDKSVVESDVACGAIVSGVIDLWQYGSGAISLSPFTKERIIQLRYEEMEDTEDSTEETEGEDV